MASTQTRKGSTSTSAQHRGSLRTAAQKVFSSVKQHNKEVNAAFQALYGIPTPSNTKTANKAPAAAVQQ
jgi:hypothetical protein